MICDLNRKIKSSEERKVVHYEEISEDLNEQKTELNRESNLAKCEHQIGIFNFNWIELSIIDIILAKILFSLIFLL